MNEELPARRIRIVLVDTQDGANIGSVCRAMKTMGLTQLVLVTGREYSEDRVRTLALHASDLWENRVEFPTLQEALKDSILSVASTRRKGKFRKAAALSPKQLTQKVSDLGEGTVSIVFGRESDGLTDEEVNLCDAVVTIPTSDLFPSLNLAQAVQIICYELYTGLRQWPSGMVVASREKQEQAVGRIIEEIAQTGYFKTDDERRLTTVFIRDMIARSGPADSELARIEKVFSKLSRIRVHHT
ncbi:MAG: RNA methyltransferase [Spirochaetales bacterium]|nr:RNA methyltransferase [Spirochaetales bacterium]